MFFQGADFLVDEDAVATLCKVLSQAVTADCIKDPSVDTSPNTALNVLQGLPVHLIESTLAAADGLSPTAWMDKFMSILDSSLHATVMVALMPYIRAQKRLQITASLARPTQRGARSCPTILKMRAAAASFSYLTRLRLSDIKVRMCY